MAAGGGIAVTGRALLQAKRERCKDAPQWAALQHRLPTVRPMLLPPPLHPQGPVSQCIPCLYFPRSPPLPLLQELLQESQRRSGPRLEGSCL